MPPKDTWQQANHPSRTQGLCLQDLSTIRESLPLTPQPNCPHPAARKDISSCLQYPWAGRKLILKPENKKSAYTLCSLQPQIPVCTSVTYTESGLVAGILASKRAKQRRIFCSCVHLIKFWLSACINSHTKHLLKPQRGFTAEYCHCPCL